jgi:hypothetical protein
MMLVSFIIISVLISLPVSASVDSSLSASDSPSASDGCAPPPDTPPPAINNDNTGQSDGADTSQDSNTPELNNNEGSGESDSNNNEETTSSSNNIYSQPPNQTNQPPFADFQWFLNDTQILFESTSYDPDGNITQFVWWYDNYEENASYLMSYEPVFYYTFPEPGHYDVTLKVIDDDNAYDTITKTVIAYICYPPVAEYTWSQIGDMITFDGTLSYDPDGEITKYFWMYYTSYGKPIPLGHTAIINYNFSEPGSYNVSLMVTDNDGGSDTIIKTIDYIPSSELELNSEFTEESVQTNQNTQLQNSLQQSNAAALQEKDFDFIPFCTQSIKAGSSSISENVFLKINLMFLDLPNELA